MGNINQNTKISFVTGETTYSLSLRVLLYHIRFYLPFDHPVTQSCKVFIQFSSQPLNCSSLCPLPFLYLNPSSSGVSLPSPSLQIFEEYTKQSQHSSLQTPPVISPSLKNDLSFCFLSLSSHPARFLIHSSLASFCIKTFFFFNYNFPHDALSGKLIVPGNPGST